MLIADPELSDRLGAAARKRLAEMFGWSTVAGKYFLLYREVKNGHE
jgi:glycosyltransferase involved in cell wall biosynthesis